MMIDSIFPQPMTFYNNIGITGVKTCVGLLVAMATFCVMNGASAREPIGTVLGAAQTVKAKGTQGTRVLAKNDDVFYLDRISSNGTGSGEFQFSDGTKLAVGPGASLVVDEFVFKGKSRFDKLTLAAAKGTFRWISGNSASSAYKIKTPYGTLGVRGTALDVTIRNGRVYIALISGSAKFCSGSVCRTLKRSCDFIVADGRKLSEPENVISAFKNRVAASQVFPFLANPGQLSSKFRVGGGNCFSKDARKTDSGRTKFAAREAAATPEPQPEPHCGYDNATGTRSSRGKGKDGDSDS
jgi:hypothetical protein